MTRFCPVMYLFSLLANHSTSSATSNLLPIKFNGTRSSIFLIPSAPRLTRVSSVSMKPGLTQLIRIPSLPNSAAMALVIAGRRGISVAMHTPTEVKAAVTGSGRADKVQVTAMVTRILGLSQAPKPADAADAVAIAVCSIWRGSAQQRIAAAIAAGAR